MAKKKIDGGAEPKRGGVTVTVVGEVDPLLLTEVRLSRLGFEPERAREIARAVVARLAAKRGTPN